MRINKCSIIGLGKLGACMAAAIASKGFKVIGVDRDLDCIKSFNQRRAPIFEPGLEILLQKHSRNISTTLDYEQAVRNSDITFIVVPTPSKTNGEFSLHFVKQAAKRIGKALSQKNSYHIVALTSTVVPNSTEFSVKPIIEKASGKKCGRDFGLCYNPTFIALGTVIRNFLNPDLILIGRPDKKAGETLKAFYLKICDNKPSIVQMNFVNAELTKIAVNSYITTKITFANMLSEMTQRLPGGDIDVVTGALGLDLRIGKRYLKGGLGYGGPCFPRDNAALASVARKLEVKPDIPMATDIFNRRIVQRLYDLVCSEAKGNKRVGILGLSYKPLSDVLEESQGFLLASKLLKTRVKIVLYDPLCMKKLRRVFSDKAVYAKNLTDAVRLSDIVVVANPDMEFMRLKMSDFSGLKRKIVLIDCWRLFRNRNFFKASNLKYIPLGIGK